MLLFDAVIPSCLALVGCIAIDFGLDLAKYAYIGGENYDPKAPVTFGANSAGDDAVLPPKPIRYLIPVGAATVFVGIVLIASVTAFVPITLLIPILAVRFATSLVFSWVVIGIAPSRSGKLGIACYMIGLPVLMIVQWRHVVLLDSDQYLALYTSPPYLVFLVVSFGAVALSTLLSRLSGASPDDARLQLAASVVLGSHAPVLAKQLTSIVAMAFAKQSLGAAVNLYEVVVAGLAAASFWFWDRRLRDCQARKDHDEDLLRMHIGFNVMALVNGALLFQEYERWRLVTVMSMGLVITGIGLLAQEKFSSAGEKEVETTARRTSWKEISRTSSGRGSEILRLGQPPALSLPVRNMVQIVFAPAAPSSRPKKSVLMVADCRHQARKSIKGVVIDLENDGFLPSSK